MNNINNKKIVLGMSGGVDSSVCALILKQQGYDVKCLFMQNWDPYMNYDILGHIKDDKNKCDAIKDFSDAKLVANKLNIEIYYTEFIEKYWNEVFTYVINEYKNGNTPNPDVLCNKYIKFDAFISFAKQKFNIDKIAMGHYANVEFKNNEYYLVKAKDEHKDQTYFLCWLNQNQLSKVIFPIGNLLKSEVRKIAKEKGLDNWSKKDSTGICFIGERKFKLFLQNYIKIKPGKIVDISNNSIIGKHEGVMFYTIGQNKTLGLSGLDEKYYVCKKDVKKNIVYVCSKNQSDKYLSSTQCELIEFNWINDYHQWLNKPIQIRFRHTGKLVNCNFSVRNNNKVLIKHEKTKMVTPGQFGVLYCGKYCLGGGKINLVK